MRVTLLYFDGCPNWKITEAMLESLQREMCFDFDRCRVETVEDAERRSSAGRPPC